MIEHKLKEKKKQKRDRSRSVERLRFDRRTEVEVLHAELKSMRERLELEQTEHRNAVTSMS